MPAALQSITLFGMTAADIVRALNLKPHPTEGGFFVETYCSEARLSAEVLRSAGIGDCAGTTRAFATAIYYLLTPDTCSEMHQLCSDELFHFYLGDPVEMLQLFPNGNGTVLRLGTDIQNDQRPQVLVPKGVWQGSRLVPGGRFALLGTTMSPGFDYADYRRGSRDDLVHRYPRFAQEIIARTR